MDLKEFDRDERHRIPVDRKREGVPSRGAGSFDATTEQIHRIGEERRRAAALRIESVAGAAHHAAGDLEDQFPQTARYLRDTAAGLEHLSSILRDPHLDEVGTLIGNLGRKQPTAIVAGAVLIGLGLSWFLKNSVGAAGRTAPDASACEEGPYAIC